MKHAFPDTAKQAAEEYLWFLSKGYPQAAALKLVGDKFKLTRDMRQVLYRGWCPRRRQASEVKKLERSGKVTWY